MTEIGALHYRLSYYFFEKIVEAKTGYLISVDRETIRKARSSFEILLGSLIANAMCLQKLGHSTINAL